MIFREKLLYRLLFFGLGEASNILLHIRKGLPPSLNQHNIRRKSTAIYYLFTKAKFRLCVSAMLIEHAPLEEVYIFFDTATYDQIERDVKVDIETFAKNTISKENRGPISLLTRFTYDLYHKAIRMIH